MSLAVFISQPELAGGITATPFTGQVLSMKASAWHGQTLLLLSLEGCLVSYTDFMVKQGLTQP